MGMKDAEFQKQAAELEVEDIKKGIKKSKASKVGILVLILVIMVLLIVAVKLPVVPLFFVGVMAGFGTMMTALHKDDRYSQENLHNANLKLKMAELDLLIETEKHYNKIIQGDF